VTLKIPLFWGLKGGMHIIRTSAAVLGIWTYAKHNGLEEHLLDGVKAVPGFLRALIELAVSKLVDLLTPGGDRA